MYKTKMEPTLFSSGIGTPDLAASSLFYYLGLHLPAYVIDLQQMIRMVTQFFLSNLTVVGSGFEPCDPKVGMQGLVVAFKSL